MKWLTRIFGGKSTPSHQPPEQRDEHALALHARQRLMPFSKGLKDTIVAELPKDLTNIPTPKLEAHFADILPV